MVSGTIFVVMRTELIKKHNVIEPEKRAFISNMKSTPYFHLEQNFLMAKLNYFSQIKIIGTETQHVRYPKVFAININHIAFF